MRCSPISQCEKYSHVKPVYVLFLATVCTSLVPHHIHSFVYEVRNLETFNFHFSRFPSILMFLFHINTYHGWCRQEKKNLTSVLIKDWSPLAKQPLCLTNQFSIPITFDSISLSMTQFLFCDRYNYDCIFCEFTFLTVHRWLIKDMPMYKLSTSLVIFSKFCVSSGI